MDHKKKRRWLWGIVLVCGGLLLFCSCVSLVSVWLRHSMIGVKRGPYALRVINETGESLCSLNIKAASSQTYFGPDQLQGMTLESGSHFDITHLAEGYYDIRAQRCTDPSDGYGRYSVPVFSEESEWTLR